MSIFSWKKSNANSAIVPTTENLAEQKLKEIKHILFPSLELNSYVDDSGAVVKYHIDYCIDSALESVLNDLQDDHNDVTCHDTLNSVIKRLLLIRKLLKVETYIDKEVEYISVENLNLDRAVEDIR